MVQDDFVGRATELAQLDALLDRVARRDSGLLVGIRGRRQVGKSRLADELIRRATAPGIFFAASHAAPPAEERRRFVDAVAASDTRAAPTFAGALPGDWLAVFRLLAEHVDGPTIVVIDELPYLLAGDDTLEGAIQTGWDRHLSRAPVLLLLLGSDVSMMERLAAHGSPLFGRVRELRLDPLTIADTAAVTGLDPADAFDAHLVIGGYPRILQEWDQDASLAAFLERQLSDSTSPLTVVGERILSSEFPTHLQPSAVLRTIGAGERTFSGIAQRLDLNHGSLQRALRTLVDDARVVAAARPLSAKRSTDTRYLVADLYLRFWLRFVEPRLELLFRGRADVVVREVLDEWRTYRGVAVEPLVRASIERMLPDPSLPGTRFVGSYWNRSGDVEVDLVGADRDRSPATVAMLGSVKWRQRRPFGRDDLLALAGARATVPGGGDARLVGVSRAGFDTADLDVALTPDDLLAAWH